MRSDYPKSLLFAKLIDPKGCGEALSDILKDVPRTFQGDPMFVYPDRSVEKSPLYQILVAYANADKEIGYT